MSGLGRHFSIGYGHFRFLWWRIRHPFESFSAFYVHDVATELSKGKPHRTLGRNRHGPKNFLSGGITLNPENSHEQGLTTFQKILSLGLRSDHVCVDYGCGSLRIGQHLIAILDKGHYWGLDVTDRFYREGLDLLDPALLRAKAPHTLLINKANLQRVAQVHPDYVICKSVLMHIPPEELETFLDRVLGLLSPQARLLLFFTEAPSTKRIASKTWAYSTDILLTYIQHWHPHIQVTFQTGPMKRCIGRIQLHRSILIAEHLPAPESVPR